MTALQTYKRNILIGFLLYTVAIFGVNWIANTLAPPRPLLLMLALAPMLPTLMIVRAIFVFARSWDEFQKKLAFEALLLAALIVACGSFAWGFLEGVPGIPRLRVIWILPAFFGIYSVARLFVSGRYK